MAIFVSLAAIIAADDGISLSTVQSVQHQVPLTEWSMIHGTNKNLHRPRHIEGVCEKILKGTVRVGFWVGNCAGFGSANAYTGWNSVSRIYVEEVPPPQA